MKSLSITAFVCVLLMACSPASPEATSQAVNPRPICGGLVACLPPVRPLPEEQKQHVLDTLQLQTMNLGAISAYHQSSEPEDAPTAALVRILKNNRCAKETISEADGTLVKKIGSPNCALGSEQTSRVATKDSTTKEDQSALLRVYGADFLSKGKLRFLTSETQSVANLEDLSPGQYRVELNGGETGSLETAQGEKLEFQSGWVAEATVMATAPLQPLVQAYKGSMESRLRFAQFEAMLTLRFERSLNGRVLAEAFLNGERVQMDRSTFMGRVVSKINDEAIRAVKSRGR